MLGSLMCRLLAQVWSLGASVNSEFNKNGEGKASFYNAPNNLYTLAKLTFLYHKYRMKQVIELHWHLSVK